MRIGDTVAIQISKDRHLVFGKLLEVNAGVATVLVGASRYTRQLKRVRPYNAARCEINKRKKREKNRYRSGRTS